MSLSNELNNLSYTNKDFNSIYAELLEYASKISHKWVPKESDESDPGVVLLKLAALIGDKDNYNIDKNVLELMPVSVTQMPNARQIFDQCGYTMKYYRAAEGYVNIDLRQKLKNGEEPDNNCYFFPMFTMFSNEDNTIVYTSTQDSSIVCNNAATHNADVDKDIPDHVESLSIPVIQGIRTDYEINGSKVVTLENLDAYNRIYLPDTDIAENGIFITNVEENNYDVWHRSNVLDTEPSETPCYKFGVSLDGSRCYIEFPSDINVLIGDGINITYIRTLGSQGNLSPRRLKNFYGNVQLESVPKTASESVAYREANTEDFKITNVYSTSGGENPESIDDAYRSYQRVKNTFSTLVSVRDYTNYMISENYASNGYVCDRTNDIQRSYKMLQQNQNNSYFVNHIEKDSNNNDLMNAFNLCVYALTYKSDTSLLTLKDYIESFTLIQDDNFVDNVESVKSISHDFIGYENERILMLKNKYPIKAQIISKYKLTEDQQVDVLNNIKISLFIALNSKKMDFGSGVDYAVIYNAIITSDDRIKAVALDYPMYETYAVYTTDKGNTFKELRIDSASLGAYTVASMNSREELYYYDYSRRQMVQEEGIKDTNKVYYTYDEDAQVLWNKFRAEVFAKNILAGVTPLYDEDTTVEFGLTQNIEAIYTGVKTIQATTKIPVESTQIQGSNRKQNKYVVLENENVLFTAPNLVQDSNYSSYVKFLYNLNESVNANAEIELTNDDYIIFFWKAKSEDEYYSYIKYDRTVEAKYISPSFKLDDNNNLTNTNVTPNEQFTWANSLPSGTVSTLATVANGADINEFVSRLQGADWVLSGTRSISTKKENEIILNNTYNGSQYVYWITKDIIKKEDGKEYCSLQFNEVRDDEENITHYEYYLDVDEYFIYTNDSKTSLHVLGQGTKLVKGINVNMDSDCLKLSYADLITNGPDSVLQWKIVDKVASSIDNKNKQLVATEMLQYIIGPGNTIIINAEDFTPSIESFLKPVTGDITYGSIGTETSLPSRSTGICWSMKSLLTLNVGPDKPQEFVSEQRGGEVFERQKLILKDATDTEIETIENIRILTNRELHVTGSKQYDVTSVAGLTLFDTLQVASYTTTNKDNNIESGNENLVTFKDDSRSIQLTIPEDSNTEIILTDIKIVPGNYLVSLQIEDPLQELIISSEDQNSCDIQSLITSTNTDIKTIYSLVVKDVAREPNKINPQTIKLKITATNNTPDDIIVTIKPLFKYTKTTLSKLTHYASHDTSPQEDDGTQKTFEDDVLEFLNKLDPESNYNYTHKVAETDKILNPLVAESFLYKNHAYNQYTICEWDVSSVETNLNLLTNVR